MYRVLVIGAGSIGERHVRCFQATGRAEVSLVEIDGQRRAQVASRYSLSRAGAELEEGLRGVDVAVVATPAPLHVPQAAQAVRAGAHVLIEKPLSTTPDGVADLARTALAMRRTVAVAYVYRFHPALAALRQALAEGRFGRPLALVAVCGQHFPTYRPAYRDIYYARRDSGGGAIQDALTHVVDAGAWLVGPIDRLVADAAHQALEGVEVEDTVHVLARHGSVLASYSLNQHQSPNEMTLTVACESGTARFEFHAHRWRSMDHPDTPWRDESVFEIERDTLFIAQAHAFLDAVEGRADTVCSLDDAWRTLHVNLAVLASVRSQSWQTLPTGGIPP